MSESLPRTSFGDLYVHPHAVDQFKDRIPAAEGLDREEATYVIATLVEEGRRVSTHLVDRLFRNEIGNRKGRVLVLNRSAGVIFFLEFLKTNRCPDGCWTVRTSVAVIPR